MEGFLIILLLIFGIYIPAMIILGVAQLYYRCKHPYPNLRAAPEVQTD
jgi:hypothetical protein